jgi:hypothetical protein
MAHPGALYEQGSTLTPGKGAVTLAERFGTVEAWPNTVHFEARSSGAMDLYAAEQNHL